MMRRARSTIDTSNDPPRLNAWPRLPGCSAIAHHRRHDVADVGEAAGLGAVAEDGQRLPAQRLADQVGHHHAVAAGLPRADGVEQPHDGHLQARLAPVGVREGLVDALGRGVGPPGFQRRTQDPVGVLAAARPRCSCRRSRWWRPAAGWRRRPARPPARSRCRGCWPAGSPAAGRRSGAPRPRRPGGTPGPRRSRASRPGGGPGPSRAPSAAEGGRSRRPGCPGNRSTGRRARSPRRRTPVNVR